MIHVAAAVCVQNGRVLLASRPADKPPAGWEFPGGKLEPGETVQRAAVRELKEELNWNVIALDVIFRVKKSNIILDFVRIIPADDIPPQPCENQKIKWVELKADFPENMLENDREFWNFLNGC